MIPFLFPINPIFSQNFRIFKILLFDRLISSSIFTLSFYYYMGLANRRNSREINKDIKIKFVPTMIDSFKLWPLAMYFNYKFIPVQYNVLYGNMIGIIWQAYLSYLQNIKFAKL